MNWYLEALQKYATFDGRARRKEYWNFTLFNAIIGVVLVFVSQTISGLYTLAIILPSIAVMVRRLHDTGRSGWLALIVFIPLVNLILLFWFLADSSPGENVYGPNPKEITA